MKKSKYIDHTLLKAFATESDIKKLCLEAIDYDFKSVCVNPTWVKYAYSLLHDTDVLVCTVIGFPLGSNTIETKVFETKNAILNGAKEIDMVINIGRAKMHDYSYILEEIKEIKKACGELTLKVIIETCYLTDEEKINVCKKALEANADYVKTSTGFGTGGATIEDVLLMDKAVSSKLKVKASGGIKTKDDFEHFINAAASRIGTSNGTSLVEKEK